MGLHTSSPQEAYSGGAGSALEKFGRLDSDEIVWPQGLRFRWKVSGMVSLVHCIYASTATSPFNETQLAILVQDARAKNQRLDVTGILVYMSGRFLQILEGETSVVERLYTSIKHDQRHKEVTQIIFESIRAREFRDWPMSLIDLSGDKLRQLVLEADPTNGTLSVSHLPNGRAKKLLLAFCEGRWGPTLADTTTASTT